MYSTEWINWCRELLRAPAGVMESARLSYADMPEWVVEEWAAETAADASAEEGWALLGGEKW